MGNLNLLQSIAKAHLRHRRCHNAWQHKATKPPYNVTFRVLRGFVRRSDGTEAHWEQFTVKYLQWLHTAQSLYGNAIWATGWGGVGWGAVQTKPTVSDYENLAFPLFSLQTTRVDALQQCNFVSTGTVREETFKRTK